MPLRKALEPVGAASPRPAHTVATGGRGRAAPTTSFSIALASRHYLRIFACLVYFAFVSGIAHAGAQAEEKLSASVQTALASAIADRSATKLIGDPWEVQAWLADMSTRLAKRMPDSEQRNEFLVTVQYEASRAGLDPQLLLAVINHESAFRKYAVSSASARGYTQVMPFWVRLIGTPEHNLFHLRTNLRYGCVILRHYLDIEKGNVVRALARYNGSLGRFEYPNAVLGLLESRWKWQAPKA